MSLGQGGDSGTGLSSFHDLLRESSTASWRAASGGGWKRQMNQLGQFAAALPCLPCPLRSQRPVQRLQLKQTLAV